MNKTVAIITARGGSKRIPRKNIKSFLGYPIIKYSIDAAFKAGCFDEVMVSTDDREIAKIAESLGAKVPFFRSEATSNDMTGTAEVIEEVILEYKKRNKNFEYCCCIYPTAPFISPKKLLDGYNLLAESDADSVIPVVKFGYPLQRAFKMEDEKLAMIWPENYSARSQDLTAAYHDSGQFYWLRSENFLNSGKIFTSNSLPIELPESEVQDIDTEEDWKIAEIKYRILNKMD